MLFEPLHHLTKALDLDLFFISLLYRSLIYSILTFLPAMQRGIMIHLSLNLI